MMKQQWYRRFKLQILDVLEGAERMAAGTFEATRTFRILFEMIPVVEAPRKIRTLLGSNLKPKRMKIVVLV